jgi:hypothetical protein
MSPDWLARFDQRHRVNGLSPVALRQGRMQTVDPRLRAIGLWESQSSALPDALFHGGAYVAQQPLVALELGAMRKCLYLDMTSTL